jgi:diguanylate cyclase (GGDEF)-like protein
VFPSAGKRVARSGWAISSRAALILAASVLILASLCAAERYTFKEYVEGLGNLNIKCIYQDRAGFLWIGTHGGAYRYDGNRFEEFGPQQGITIPSIEDIREDGDGRIWIGTSGGIFVKERNESRFERVLLDGKPSGVRVGSRLSSLPNGSLAIAVEGAGLYVTGGTGTALQLRPIIPPGLRTADTRSVHGLTTGSDGAIWFGCGSQVCRYKADSLLRWNEASGLVKEDWEYLLFDHKGQLWVRGRSHIAVLQVGANRFEARDIPGAVPNLDYRPLGLDSQDRVLVPSGKLLARFEGDHWRVFSENNGLSGEVVTAAFADREGSVWIGVWGHGLERWLGYDQWEHWTKADGLRSNIVWRAVRDQVGRLWINDDKGISIMEPNSSELRRWIAPGGSTDGYTAIGVSRDGFVWLGVRNHNLLRVKVKDLHTTRFPLGDISELFVDSHDRVWLADLEGLFVSEPGTNFAPRSPFRRVRGRGLPERGFEDITEAPDGRLWVACDDGLVTGDSKEWTRVELDWKDLGSRTLLDVRPDLDGNVWVDGYFPGLVRAKVKGAKLIAQTRFQRPTITSDQYALIGRDPRGWMWFGGDRGVDVFDGSNWRQYTQDDGLVWNDVAAKAFLAEPDGSIWIGTGGGLSHLRRMTPIARPPAPTFVSSRFGTRNLENGAVVPWGGEPLTIDLASLSFRNERARRFRYRLRELEPGWTETAQHEIHYAQLPPGHYQFEVVALGSSKASISPVTTLSFEIKPPWWRTRWFFAFVLAASIVLLLFLWSWSNRRIIAREAELKRIVKARTRELEAEKAELLQAKAALAEQATHDSLTGMLNRAAILQVVEQEILRATREQTSFAVVLADLDHFKVVNDTYGHLAGDEVLRQFARRLSHMLRSYDRVGRYGGEEVLIVIPGLSGENARRISKLHGRLLEEPYVHEDLRLMVTCSFGVAWFHPADTVESLLSSADQALYRAKANGRARVAEASVTGMSTQRTHSQA